MLKICYFLSILIMGGCRTRSSNVNQKATESDVSSVMGFAPIPKDCGELGTTFFKVEYCDGYWMRNSTERGVNDLPQNKSSNWPTEEGLKLISGDFDPNKPTVIFIHGWMGKVPKGTTVGFPDMWRDQAKAAGFNVGVFSWHNLASDDGKNCLGEEYLDSKKVNSPCHAAYSMFQKGGASDLFLSQYEKSGYFSDSYKKEVRLVGHSLGTQLALFSAYRFYHHPTFERGFARPTRVDLIDPAFAVFTSKKGLGRHLSGMIPDEHFLPDDYQKSVVREFVHGSDCDNTAIIKLNDIFSTSRSSQYCQLEGMAYDLVKKQKVAVVDFSSIVGGISSEDLYKVTAYQAFSSKAFQGSQASRHGTPLVSYWFSFAPGDPEGGFDASTDTSILLDIATRQIGGEQLSTRQTEGFDTITLDDDKFERRKHKGCIWPFTC
jgi:hypothetical protein